MMMMTMDMETTAELTENESITPEAPIQQQQQQQQQQQPMSM